MLGTVTLEVLDRLPHRPGRGEGPAAPSPRMPCTMFPDSLRALPRRPSSAQTLGFRRIVAVPLLTLIIKHYTWHWAFGALGIAGLVWAVPGSAFRAGRHAGRSAGQRASRRRSGFPTGNLLTCPQHSFAVCCAGFASYWGLALGLTWFTSYLVTGLGFSQEVGGNLTILRGSSRRRGADRPATSRSA